MLLLTYILLLPAFLVVMMTLMPIMDFYLMTMSLWPMSPLSHTIHGCNRDIVFLFSLFFSFSFFFSLSYMFCCDVDDQKPPTKTIKQTIFNPPPTKSTNKKPDPKQFSILHKTILPTTTTFACVRVLSSPQNLLFLRQPQPENHNTTNDSSSDLICSARSHHKSYLEISNPIQNPKITDSKARHTR